MECSPYLSLSVSALDHHLKMKNIYGFDGPWAALRRSQFRLVLLYPLTEQ